MTKDEVLRLAHEGVEIHSPNAPEYKVCAALIAALEAKDEPVNDELRRLHDLLGKANALARIRAAEIESMKASLYGLYELEKQRDELEQRLTKTEALLIKFATLVASAEREALEKQVSMAGGWQSPAEAKTITAIKEALAQPEQEPVAFEKTVCPFCTSEWVTAEQHDRNVDRVERKPLTDEEIGAILEGVNAYGTRLYTFARAIEAAHGIKETEK